MLTEMIRKNGCVVFEWQKGHRTTYLFFREEDVGDSSKGTECDDSFDAVYQIPEYTVVDSIGVAMIYRASHGCQFRVAIATAPPHKGIAAHGIFDAKQKAALMNARAYEMGIP